MAVSNVVKAAVPVVKVAGKFVAKHWKSLAEAFTLVAAFIKAHPEIPDWFKARLDDVQRRVAHELQKHDPKDQIRGVLKVVREEAAATGHGFDPEPWSTRADALEQRVRLAALLPPKDRKTALADLKSETADLLSDLMLAIGQHSTGPQADPA